MTNEKLNIVLATCAAVLTVAACVFVGIKSRNDGSIARDTGRIADAMTPSDSKPSRPTLLTVEEHNQRWSDMNFDTEKKARESCQARGKSVIRSGWDSRMVDCR